MLDGGATRVIPINSERNPIFPGMRAPEPIDQNLTKLKKVVKESGADVGIAFDGDADRVGLVDEKGRFINQLQVFGLLAYYLLEVKGWRGPIVKSLSTTSMVNRLGELYNVPVYRDAGRLQAHRSEDAGGQGDHRRRGVGRLCLRPAYPGTRRSAGSACF